MKFKHCFMASCFLLLTTTASFAEVRELDSYTVDLPAQWDVEQQGQFWESYTAPGSSDIGTQTSVTTPVAPGRSFSVAQ